MSDAPSESRLSARLSPKRFRFVGSAVDLAAKGAPSLRIDDEAVQAKLVAVEYGKRRDRYATAAAESTQEGALGRRRHAGVAVVDGGGDASRLVVVAPRLDGEGALARRGQHRFQGNDLRRFVEPAQSRERGGGDDNGVEFARFHLRQARVDVAPDGDDLHVGPQEAQLCGATHAARADARARSQLRQRRLAAAHQRVAGVFAARDGGQGEAVGVSRRQVLEAVDGDVDFARREAPLPAPS